MYTILSNIVVTIYWFKDSESTNLLNTHSSLPWKYTFNVNIINLNNFLFNTYHCQHHLANLKGK